VNDWCYVLQDPDLTALGASRYDLVVIDYSADGTQALDAADVTALRASTGGKIVVAYLSIGEAEDYRFYWEQAHGSPGADWTADPPAWIGPTNPDWPGNYEVRYWDPAWQALIIHNPGGHPVIGDAPSYLDRILDAGFDGVFLDIVDGYEFWGPSGDGGNGERPDAAKEMARFVTALAAHARSRKPAFLVCQQNASGLIGSALERPLPTTDRTALLGAVDWISTEDVFYNGPRDENNPLDVDPDRVTAIDAWHAAGKLVTVIDYFDASRPGFDAGDLDDFWTRARAHGWIPYTGPRALDRLVITPGHEPE